MYIDFKITAWERLHVPEHCEDVILEKLKNGLLDSSESVFRFLDEHYKENPHIELLYDTEEQMTIEENGNSTIEVIDDVETIWTNAPDNN